MCGAVRDDATDDENVRGPQTFLISMKDNSRPFISENKVKRSGTFVEVISKGVPQNFLL